MTVKNWRLLGHLIRGITHKLVIIWVIMLPVAAWAFPGKISIDIQHKQAPTDLARDQVTPELFARHNIDGKAFVLRHLAFYHRAFPHLGFLWLRTSAEASQVSDLPQLLGRGADDQDYVHGPAVRKLLLNAEVSRITTLLQQDAPSATLFHTGKNSVFPTSHLCVITLNDHNFLSSRLAATHFFLGTGQIPTKLFLPDVSALRFTLDHEVFHCLDAYLYGPIFPKTRSHSHSQYSQLKAEMRADFFASLMHRRDFGDDGFVNKFAEVRTLGLLDWDIAHFTRMALDSVPNQSAVSAKDHSIRDLANMTRATVKRLMPSYAYFLRWRAAAYQAAINHGSQQASENPQAANMAIEAVNPSALIHIDDQLTQATRLMKSESPQSWPLLNAANTVDGHVH